MKELVEILNMGKSRYGEGGLMYWYAASLVLREEKLSIEDFTENHSSRELIDFLNAFDTEEWQRKIEAKMNKFNSQLVFDESISKWKKRNARF